MNALDTQTFNQAVALANSGQKREANRQLKSLLQTNPTDGSLLLWTAFTSSDLNEAGDLLGRASAVDPGNASLPGAKQWLTAERAKLPTLAPMPTPSPFRQTGQPAAPMPQYQPLPDQQSDYMQPSRKPGFNFKKMPWWGWVFGAVLLLGILGVGIVALTSINSASSGPTPGSVVGTPSKFGSNGIGMDRADWETVQGKPLNNVQGDITIPYNKGLNNDLYEVTYHVGRIETIGRDYSPSVSLGVAKANGSLLIPSDTKFVRTYTNGDGFPAELYHSEWLKGRLPAADYDKWCSPGDFSIIYFTHGGNVTDVTVAPCFYERQ